MAPPPSASLPLTQRLMQLFRTLQFGWFVGHLTLIFCTLRYSLSYITFNYYSGWAQFCYRTTFIAAAGTYGIVVFKAYRARARSSSRPQSDIKTITGDENVQYLTMALVWLFFPRQVPLALLPFAIYSVFHVATYTRSNLLPTIQPPKATATPGASSGERPLTKSSGLQDTIGRFIKEYYEPSMFMVAALEILLWFRLLLSALAFSKGGWILFLFYTVFFRARLSQSSFVQNAFGRGATQVDALVANQSTPPVARQAWQTVKGLARQAVDATDFQRYFGGSRPSARKTQ